MTEDETKTEAVEEEVEVLDLGKCIALVNKEGGVRLKCEQNVEKIEIDEQGLSMIKGISELAVKQKSEEKV